MEQELLNMGTAPGSPEATESIVVEAPTSVKVSSANGKKRTWMLACGERPIRGMREDSPEAGAGVAQMPELELDDKGKGKTAVEVKAKRVKPPIAPRLKRAPSVMAVQPARAQSPLPMFEREPSLWQETPAAEDSETMLAVRACVREPVQRELDLESCGCVFDGVQLEPITQLSLHERMLEF
jgi:hypothetical protein